MPQSGTKTKSGSNAALPGTASTKSDGNVALSKGTDSNKSESNVALSKGTDSNKSESNAALTGGASRSNRTTEDVDSYDETDETAMAIDDLPHEPDPERIQLRTSRYKPSKRLRQCADATKERRRTKAEYEAMQRFHNVPRDERARRIAALASRTNTLLSLPMLFFTLWLGFPNITQVGRAIRILRTQPEKGEAEGDVSQWAALSTALSGTIGHKRRGHHQHRRRPASNETPKDDWSNGVTEPQE